MLKRDREWKRDIQTAKDLRYSREVIEKVKEEPDPMKRCSILQEARESRYNEI